MEKCAIRNPILDCTSFRGMNPLFDGNSVPRLSQDVICFAIWFREYARRSRINDARAHRANDGE